MHNNSGLKKPQGGVATVLIILLVGLSLSAVVLGTGYYIRSQQQQDMAAHSLTQAQMKAWTGAELVQQYLKQLQDVGELQKLYAQPLPIELTLSGIGVTDAVFVQITGLNPIKGIVTAQITGVSSSGSPAESRAVLVVDYAAAASSSGQCAAPRKTTAVLRGDVTITGGTTSFTSKSTYSDLAIDGSLTISNASQAIISGCTKGDITLSGGGIDANATLSSQNGSIRINSMAQPTNATLWARAISIGNTGSANYNALKAGAYQANVIGAGNLIVGATLAGGKLIKDSAGPNVPWTTGTIIPWPTGTLLINLSDGGEYLVDMTKATINQSTGAVSKVRSASEKINSTGSTEIPDDFILHATGVSAGSIEIYTLSVDQTWGNSITMLGYGGTYNKVWPAGHFQAVNPAINSLVGGGDMWAKQAGCGKTGSCWNFPTFKENSKIAGSIYYGADKTLLVSAEKLQANAVGTSPGLPGVPFCDTRTEQFDASSFRSTANYIFEFDAAGKPILTIQNVKSSNGSSIDRKNIDLTSVDPVPATALEAMTLRRINGNDFLGCNNQAPNNKFSDALACFRNATPQKGWLLNGITKFPPGIALFIGPVTVDGVASSQGALNNTLLSTGNVTLTGSGHGPLVAPNFVTPVSTLCDGSFYPSNLCTKKSNEPTTLVKWTDEKGVEHYGLPLANIAIGSNKGLNANSWDKPNGITGNIVLGEAISTGGATLSIDGTLTVGTNVQTTTTTITQGGLRMDSGKVTTDQSYLPGGSCTQKSTQISIKWSRFL